MYAHRVKVLDRTDDHDVVSQVAHHFQFEFLPTENRFFDQNFVNRRRREPMAHNLFELFRIECRAATRAAQRERGTDDRRIVRFLHKRFGFGPGCSESSTRHLQPGFVHRLLEEHAIFSDLNRFALRANHFHAAFIEHTGVGQGNGQIQRRLSTDSWKQGVRSFTFDDRRD